MSKGMDLAWDSTERVFKRSQGHPFAINWEDYGIPPHLVEYEDKYGPHVALLGKCSRGHLVEVAAHPKYMKMNIGCPAGKCPGIVRPAAEDVVTVFRLLGRVAAEKSYLEAWLIERGARRG